MKMTMEKIKRLCCMACAAVISISMLAGCGKKFSLPSDYVDPNDDSVTIKVVEDSVTDQGLTLEITNNTNMNAGYGKMYILEQKRDGVWYREDESDSFTAIGIEQKPLSTRTFDITFASRLDKGEYRIIKDVGVDKEFYTAAEFTVK
ncbi:immunoglobulin-like domain-containing protein [Ruminococcus sp.]|uniref:immunoglobulin-like domain-containing protein n=1 Tax=Ruminococcus sp. TaxID=41978 RepID=UPI0025ED2FCF|nr:immunoglobulin-like domain-containing protein [Ruminococcus sp.]